MKAAGHRIVRWGGSLSEISLSAAFLLAWLGPNATAARGLADVIGAEFALLMVGLPLVVFLAGPLHDELKRLRNRKPFIAFGAVLAAALLAIGCLLSRDSGSWTPLLAAVALLGAKLRLLLSPARDTIESLQILGDAVLRLALLFFLLFPCAFLPLPELGLKGAFSGWANFSGPGLMAWGFLYFGFFGVLGPWLHDLIARSHRENRS
jgi:Ca2+/Na+ antiporter